MTDFNLKTTANASQGKGGTCNGDSGGPVYFGATNVIAAVTSFGMNGQCKGLDFSLPARPRAGARLDQRPEPGRPGLATGFAASVRAGAPLSGPRFLSQPTFVLRMARLPRPPDRADGEMARKS